MITVIHNRLKMKIQAHTRILSYYGWKNISHTFPNLAQLIQSLVRMEFRAIRDEGEMPKGVMFGRWSSQVEMAAWKEIEEKLLPTHDKIVEFNNKLNREEVGKSFGSAGVIIPYFAKGLWIKDVGPIGKKIERIITETALDHI